MPKRVADDQPLPAARLAAAELESFLMLFINEHAPDETYVVKVERALAHSLGLAAEWTRVIKIIDRGGEVTDVYADNDPKDQAAVCSVSYATLALVDPAARLAEARAHPDGLYEVSRKTLGVLPDSQRFTDGAPIGGYVRVVRGVL